ncbi:hypothetical protein S7335_2025 [Synechococcus sp. PCC 7335]|nr:hypothetical protein S7335_2025 [Synechococcus sp. PCC 7335]
MSLTAKSAKLTRSWPLQFIALAGCILYEKAKPTVTADRLALYASRVSALENV